MLNSNLFIEILHDAKAECTACASINILNYNTARAVIHAAQRAARAVILQPSVGTVKRYGVLEMYRMINVLRQNAAVPVALHLDHCTDDSLAKACVDAGWDAVMMDYSAKSLEENITRTKAMVDYAYARGVAVEGEVGVIAGVEDDIVHETAQPTSYEDTIAYIEQSGVDAIAPAIGTAHGVYKGKPVLDFDLVERLGQGLVPVVVHGGTGLPEDDFHKLIRLGAAKINISTALKHAYLGASRDYLQNPGIAPVEFDKSVENAVSETMERYIRLFAGEDVKL